MQHGLEICLSNDDKAKFAMFRDHKTTLEIAKFLTRDHHMFKKFVSNLAAVFIQTKERDITFSFTQFKIKKSKHPFAISKELVGFSNLMSTSHTKKR